MSESLTVPIPREALLYPNRRTLPRAWATIKELRRYRDLHRYLVQASLRTENTGTVFGFLWWLLDPLLLMLVYIVLVQVIFHASEPAFPVFVMCAILPWESFNDSVRMGMANTLGRHRAMLQIAFPRAILPLSATSTAAVHLALVLPFLVFAALIYGISPSPYNLYAIPIAAIEMTLALGLSYLLSAANMVFRDMSHLIDPLFRMWFLLSPGIYSIDRIPEKYRTIFLLNPLAEIFTGFRDAFIYHTVLPVHQFVYVTVVAVVTAVVGYLTFIRLEPSFAKID